jgi:hypothetical protein
MSLVPAIEYMIANFSGNILHREGLTNLKTKEGSTACTEALEYVKTAKPTQVLTWSPELYNAA